MLSTTEIAAVVGITGVSIFLLRCYLRGGSCRSQARLDHKTVIITGGNTGIGKETAIDLAKRGARIILACRSESKAMDAIRDIIKLSGNSNVVFRKLDLASFQSVRDFAKHFNENEARLDILINNAGVMMCPYTQTADGFEMQFGTNHLGHFLLTNLLLDKLKACTPSRIVVVSSKAHRRGKMNFHDLNNPQNYNPYTAYFQSKLANVLFVRQLSHRLQGTGVTANSLHPGVVHTDLLRHFSIYQVGLFNFLLAPLFWLVLKTSKQGAQTTIFCAVDESLNGVTGEYFADCRQKDCAPQACDDGVAKKLWEVSEEWTGFSSRDS
ncbi:Retinol dehydrogenase 13 [Trichoplax sp. H2]|nr:Retinol dehydrogenase 13 [Trichoplax sp. H2]RDD39355.1 Retinol dehydrogenase 13 [Trichoplax sp. H2]|eukprot:RDD36616.1 Retinol dehydrogenase 13 [Trichoplax sp. H2]